jgi:hypothetical protein
MGRCTGRLPPVSGRQMTAVYGRHTAVYSNAGGSRAFPKDVDRFVVMVA